MARRVLCFFLSIFLFLPLFSEHSSAASEAEAWITDAEISGDKIGVSIFSRTELNDIYLTVAGYRHDGKMTDIVSEVIDASEGGSRFVLPLPESGDTYRVFLFDGLYEPLCGSVSASSQVPEDFERAFEMGYVDASYADRNRSEQMVSTEFKAMLEDMISETAPGRVSLFRSKVTDYSVPMTRNHAMVMIWYAAVCMGVDDAYTGGETIDYISLLDDYFGGYDSDWDSATKLTPEVQQYDLPIETKFWGTQTNVRTVACAWNAWHLSPTWGMPAIAVDTVEMSMRWTDPFTVEDAVCAVSRLYDSYDDAQEPVFAPINSAEAKSPNANIITDDLIAKADAAADAADNELPLLSGVSLELIAALGYEHTDISGAAYQVADIAEWGFNQVQLLISYKQFFSEDVAQVNLKNFRILDEMIATALENGLHVTLDMFQIPGMNWYIDPEKNFETTWVNDIYVDEDAQALASKAWQLLTERYSELPGTAVSFATLSTRDGLITSPGSNHTTDYSDKTPNELMYLCVNTDQILIDAIRDIDDDRYVIYSMPFTYYQQDYATEQEYRDIIESYEDFGNILGMETFVQEPYVYFNMNDSPYRQPDTQNNAMFVGEYPVRIYAAQKHITGPDYTCSGEDHAGSVGEYAGEHSMTINGTLPAGTKVEVYLERWRGLGEFRITADGDLKISDAITSEFNYWFEVDEVLSRRVRFAESEKKYSFTLTEEAESITLSCTEAGEVWWSGIRLTLPEEYEVMRLYKDTEYSANLEGREHEGTYYKNTSELLIGANTNATEWPVSESDEPYRGGTLTVTADGEVLDYSSDAIYERADKESIEAWGAMVDMFFEDYFVHWEYAAGGSSASALAYYEDMLSMLDKYGFSRNGRYEYVQLVSATDIDAKTVKRGRYLNFDEERLQTMLRNR